MLLELIELRRLYEDTLFTGSGLRDKRYGGERPLTIL